MLLSSASVFTVFLTANRLQLYTASLGMEDGMGSDFGVSDDQLIDVSEIQNRRHAIYNNGLSMSCC